MINNLPEISFAYKDPAKIKADLVARYKAESGRTLAEADPLMSFVNVLTAMLVGIRADIDFTGKQNTLAYAVDEYLDHKCTDFDLKRKEAEKARVTMLFTLSQVLPRDIVIPKDTQVTADSKVFFAVPEDTTVPAGSESISIICIATESGTAANNYAIGEIVQLVVRPAGVDSVVNLDISAGGTIAETNDQFVERRLLAPAALSNAGPDDNYKYYARSASSAVIDVQVKSPTPGIVNIIALMTDGRLPTDAELELIATACNPEHIRPLTDNVVAVRPKQVDYEIDFEYWVSSKSSVNLTQLAENVEKATAQFIYDTQTKIGNAVNISRLEAMLMATGIRRVNIKSPKQTELTCYQVAKNVAVNIEWKGVEVDY
jgi:phage-related baseplate assembly protein